MKILLSLPLFISFIGKSQEFKSYKNAYDFLSNTVRPSIQALRTYEFGFVLLQSVVVHGELTSIKTLYADSKLLESDASKVLSQSSGKWKFCSDSTVIIVPFTFYYNLEDASSPTRYFPGSKPSRPIDIITSDELVNGVILPTVRCKISISVSECIF